jgi:hypothetical protein
MMIIASWQGWYQTEASAGEAISALTHLILRNAGTIGTAMRFVAGPERVNMAFFPGKHALAY